MKTPESATDIKVGGKTSDEIKKGLKCCSKIEGCKNGGCSYYDLGSGSICIPAMTGDALAYIQQLEAQNAELQAELDAALEDKRGECTYCAYLPGETIPQTCFDCANKGFYRWEWRGVQKEG